MYSLLKQRMLLSLVALVLIAGMSTGCGIFSPDEGGDGGGGGGGTAVVQPATTPDKAIANLEIAYENRDIDTFVSLIHDDYLFEFNAVDAQALAGTNWQGDAGNYNRQAEVEGTTAMFSGSAGYDWINDREVPKVIDITFDVVPEPTTGDAWWDGGDQGQEYVGTLARRYQVTMLVYYETGNPSEIVAVQRFHVVPVEKTIGGNQVTVYQIKFWVDTGVRDFS